MEKEERLLIGVCDLKGSQMAQMALLTALIAALPRECVEPLRLSMQEHAESVETLLLHSPVSEHTRAALSRDLELFHAALKARS